MLVLLQQMASHRGRGGWNFSVQRVFNRKQQLAGSERPFATAGGRGRAAERLPVPGAGARSRVADPCGTGAPRRPGTDAADGPRKRDVEGKKSRTPARTAKFTLRRSRRRHGRRRPGCRVGRRRGTVSVGLGKAGHTCVNASPAAQLALVHALWAGHASGEEKA